CENEYDGPIVSFLVSNGTQTFDALANPDVTFNARGSDYTVYFVIHAPSMSSQNNTNPGTFWYDQDAYGFGEGGCLGGASPNQNVTISQSYGPFCKNCGPTEIDFGTVVNGVSFKVNWLWPPLEPENLQASAGNEQVTLSWSPPLDDGGTAITNYNIARSTTIHGVFYPLTTTGNVLSYNDTQVTNG